MAQLTIYLDEGTLRKIELAAKRAHESISKWVRSHLVTTLETNWPADYFNLFGSLANQDLARSDQGSFSRDVPRGKL